MLSRLKKIVLLSIFLFCSITIFRKISIQKKLSNSIQTSYYESEYEIFEEYYFKAEQIMNNMTLEEKVGQMLMARCSADDVISEIKKLSPGGYIIYEDKFIYKNKEEIQEMIKSYQDASKIPLLIGVDEEGGTVARLSSSYLLREEKFKSPLELYKIGGINKILEEEKEKIEFLKEFGINLNLAPVVDVSTNEEDYIYDRTIGQDAKIVSKYSEEMTKLYNDMNFGMSLKHFPGYGSNNDTHYGIVYDKRSEDEFKEKDYLPFIAGINQKAQCIMFCHNVLVYKDKYTPCSLLKDAHDILRNELGFSGIIITDDIGMLGIRMYVSEDAAAVLAVNAGNDLIITSNLSGSKKAILKAVEEGIIEEKTINIAVRRILAWKCYIGLID